MKYHIELRLDGESVTKVDTDNWRKARNSWMHFDGLVQNWEKGSVELTIDGIQIPYDQAQKRMSNSGRTWKFS